MSEAGLAARCRVKWRLRTRSLALGQRTLLMGIVNVTPDSFSDGGAHASSEAAVSHALCLLDDGADVLDIGGESTRPGSMAATAEAVSAREEQARVLPVLRGILRARPEAILSVDTYRSQTARLAVEAGAEIVNDVSGLLWDRAMAETCATLRCGTVLMHTRGLPSEWAAQPSIPGGEVVQMILPELRMRVEAALFAGMAREHLLLDPGFGFGKRGGENWELLARFAELQELGFPLLAGVSRKGFLTGANIPPHQRDAATHAAGVVAILQGAHVLRVHDVRGAREMAAVADAVRAAAMGKSRA